ncbi:MAG: iron-containing alcohol dehydrogenase [Alphaproteobacteria bacterium]|nr:iron-containing alcohol dehydrogenase [Alphaproteobacteria bacterium]
MATGAGLRGNWNYPTAIRFGAGRIAELAEACRVVGMARPLLVTDPGLKETAMVQGAIAANEKSGLPTGLFAEVRPNPSGRNVDDGVAAFRAGAHDGVIAFGGGSALDVGKAIALMAGQHRPIWDFEDREDWWTRVDEAGLAPVVALPTTAGTGSEVGRVSVITDESVPTKKLIFHPRLMPRLVIADPALTLGLPAHLTAATGMDALAHNLEAYCAQGFHPMADGVALEGMRLIKNWLPVAVRDGANLEARTHMMVASTMGATAFQKGLGAIHALSHPVGSLFDAHHGLTNAVFMPYVLAFNRPAIADKLSALARYLDLSSPSPEAVIAWTLALRKEIGVPHTLAELGVPEAGIEKLVPLAEVDQARDGNPRPLSRDDLKMLFEAAWRGELPQG